MFTIGDFAKLGGVSVRMLRHYDALGLLPPASVDPVSGYRLYRAEQLWRLNKLVALKGLGFTLQQVQAILDDQVPVAELRGMLRLRREELAAQVAADTARLAMVEARLRMIEKEGRMATHDITLKQVAPLRVAELTAVAAGYSPEHIGPTISPLYPELMRRLDKAGLSPLSGPAIAYYEPADDAVLVHAAMPVAADLVPGHDFAVVDLPAIHAATVIHRGPMDDVLYSLQALARWVEQNGYRMVGYHREVYLDYLPDNPENGVTELQIAVTPA
ncbi:MerR family transcriptional regulator [Catellatospora citrea]|uniref:MerR family transcriptional regulator n=1 Tax=Catellatospora citrea TaxID=53366 RepID=A0A8J3K9T7_9ACTN|nr:MerR family transcriptional regulator [Catellatospora citrea]RKE07446.1 DNA-binding transcriptional MerR regulator [Catellatospora citrea]GIF95602.1 MerR family transcriptional regulator [Catellatospora citrea]